MTGQARAAWYPDPYRRHESRYWDGSRWTHNVTSRGTRAIDPTDEGSAPQATSRAGWYPDPFQRHDLRFWDGDRWTDHVTTRGRQELDPLDLQSPAPVEPRGGDTADRPQRKIQRQVRSAGAVSSEPSGGGSLLSEPVLVVNQKAKLVEVNAEYAVYNQHGHQIGAVREVGQSFMKNAIAPRPSSMKTKRLQIVDENGRMLIALTRPATIARSTVIARHADGTEIGRIVQRNIGIIGKVRFGLESGGQQLGSINAEGWNVWDFNIEDASGSEIARITKTWSGWTRQVSTKRDKYVVQIHRPLDDPLRSLVLAAALAVDTALRQQN